MRGTRCADQLARVGLVTVAVLKRLLAIGIKPRVNAFEVVSILFAASCHLI